jgi:carboxyl-terminal processing protease
MNRKITLGGAVTLAIMFSAVTFIMTMIYARNTFDSMVFNIKERETMYAKLSEVDRLVRQRYFRRIDEDKLSEDLIKGYISGMSATILAPQGTSIRAQAATVLYRYLVG